MKKFKKVYLEITNICNLNCDFCPKTSRNLKFMSENEFSSLIPKIKPHTDHVYFHLMGEPLLNPNLQSFLNTCHEYQLKVNITTNAVLLPKVKDILLQAKSLRQINISLHSFEANDSNLTLQDYVLQIADFVQAAKQTNLIISIRLWNMDSETLKGRNELNGDIISLLQDELKPEVNIREGLQGKCSLKLFKNVYLNMAEKFDWPDIDLLQTYEHVFCHGLRDQIGVLVDGTVVPCCLDSEGNIPLGNLFETDLETIINGPRAKAIYDGFSARCAVEDLCKRCGYATRY